MFKDIQIETGRLIIKPFKMEDDIALQKIVSQPEVVHYLPEDVMSLDEVRHILTWFQTCYERNTPDNIIKWTLGVWLKSEALDSGLRRNDAEGGCVGENELRLIGWAGIGPWEPDETEIELFYGFGKEHWGKGFATEAAQAVMDYAFDKIGLKRLIAVANPENIGSVRVLEKIGMKFEKILNGMPQQFSNDEGSHFFVMMRS
ncbi:MAG: GNAT family N-acetyltransferase [Candidatus Zixiibacteriota bacterium]